ncbi:MAG: replication-associated recombination protein A [Chloroflexota bacterium]|nr:replication-associated recombination protein A [Chloroflexota bacterium]MDE2969038.1 replication-associated recombination protein A [Chloroflexota bacterium]
MTDLFAYAMQQRGDADAPLAARMRPRTFDEFVGQEHLTGPDRVLRRAIEADQAPSMLLWGPPGSGKTTLANLIAAQTKAHFETVSAVTAGVADLRRAVEGARERLSLSGQRTILFVDEIHRFNKAQQDVILPHVEAGTVTFIGATTENPSFEVIAPLLSRSMVYTLGQLTDEHIGTIVDRALEDEQRGLGRHRFVLEEDARELLIEASTGDARTALNILELAALVTQPNVDGVRSIALSTVEDALQHRALHYDKSGDQHYDTISAFIKSVRGSDPDAAVYWLVRMLDAGEDPLFIARRIIILAAEDIGMADPAALPVAVAAQQAVHFIGLPEGAIPLAEATVYLATAPKSNSAYAALRKAREDVQKHGGLPVPLHLRNAVTGLMRRQGYGEGYKYAHDYPEHFAKMQNLPERIKGHRYYEPSDQGYESDVAKRIAAWWGQAKG